MIRFARKIIAVYAILILGGCGTIGIGANHDVNIHNHSDDMIIAHGEMGRIHIDANQSMNMNSNGNIYLYSTNTQCNSLTIQRRRNYLAMALDIIMGAAPLALDIMTGAVYKLPREFIYTCDAQSE